MKRALILLCATTAAIASTALPAAADTTLSSTVDTTYQANGRVSAIVDVGGVEYIGGQFTSMRPAGSAAGTNETPRSYLAAINQSTGALLSWAPTVDKPVWALAASPDGKTIYAGGAFSHANGKGRARLAAFDAATGALVSTWNAPVTGKWVRGLAATSSTVYVGGSFTAVDGQARSNLGAVDASTGAIGSWGPATDNVVRVLRMVNGGTDVAVGGDFSTLGGSSQRDFALVNANTGSPEPWSSHPPWPVHDVVQDSTQFYIAGDGSGGHLAAYSFTGTRNWVEQTDGGVQAVALVSGGVIGGGHFDNVCVGDTSGATTGFNCPTNLVTRHKLVALATSDGAVLPWNPGANSSLGVVALTTSHGHLDVGGTFTKIAGKYQQAFGQFSGA